MSKYLKDLNRMLADMWVAGKGGTVTIKDPSNVDGYFWVYSGANPVYGFRNCYIKQVQQAIKGAGWSTRHAQAMASGLRKQPIRMKAMDATNDLRTVFYFDGKGRSRYVQTESGMNTPAVLLYLAYRRYSNRLNRQINALIQEQP